MSFFDLEARALDGTPLPLSRHRGKVVLVVNTASECGFTPQYAGLQALHEAYADRDLVVLGIPSNDFGGQEPRKGKALLNHCKRQYGVSFPLTERTGVVGRFEEPR